MRCEACGKLDGKRCASCNAVGYCSKACQKAHWPEHKFTCRPEAVTLADNLVHSVSRHDYPSDLRSKEAFGFGRLVDPADSLDLIEFYNYLVDDRGVTAKTLDRWLDEDLLAGILDTISVGPWTAERTRWLSWARQRTRIWRYDPDDMLTQKADADATDATWDFIYSRSPNLPPYCRHTFISQLNYNTGDPRALPSISFMLYKTLRRANLPGSSDWRWLCFGFVATYGQGGEALGRAYGVLIERCSFDEFCHAAGYSQLLALFARYDALEAPHPELADVLGGSPHHFNAVWHLKQYVATCSAPGANIVGKQLFAPDEKALAAFGFTSSFSAGEKHKLQQLYGKVLLHEEARPLELQLAMERDSISDYILRLPYLGKILKSELRLLQKLATSTVAA